MKTSIMQGAVQKIANSRSDIDRLQREKNNLRRLAQTGLVPQLLRQRPDRLEREYIAGESMEKWLHLDYMAGWRVVAPLLPQSLDRLRRYATLEQTLLRAGVLYRDLNLQHLIFTLQGARIVDLEAAEIQRADGLWRVTSRRGTYETMAPEEFTIGSRLTARTASYWFAIVAHLVLAGCLPFRSVPQRWRAYRNRRCPAAIAPQLPAPVRRVLAASLQCQPARRHSDPARLMQALEHAYA